MLLKQASFEYKDKCFTTQIKLVIMQFQVQRVLSREYFVEVAFQLLCAGGVRYFTTNTTIVPICKVKACKLICGEKERYS